MMDYHHVDSLEKLKTINGIIHVGANVGQEIPIYKKYTDNIILIEPLQHLCDSIRNMYSDCLVINCAVGVNEGFMDFYVSSNNGESSSLYRPKTHLTHYPDIVFNETIKVPVKRMETLLYEHPEKIQKCNVLIIDTQGADLDVVKSFGPHILTFDMICLEYINCEYYDNNDNHSNDTKSIDDYLTTFNFKLKYRVGDDNLAGDVVYCKNK